MFGRIAKMFLAAALADIGSAVIRSGGRWLDRKLSPKTGTPDTSAATTHDQ